MKKYLQHWKKIVVNSYQDNYQNPFSINISSITSLYSVCIKHSVTIKRILASLWVVDGATNDSPNEETWLRSCDH